MNVDSPQYKKVRFNTNHFYSILDNLYVSDQISSFNEELLESNKITYLINFTKSTPFISKHTKNIQYHFLNHLESCNKSLKLDSQDRQNETIQKINHVVHELFTLLSQKENVLLYCENGTSKSFIILACFLMKYYNSEQIISIEQLLRFINWKTKQSFSEDSTPYFSLLKQYRTFLQGKKPFDIVKKQMKQHKIASIVRNHFSTK
jgi:protein-tyrosine phosphatase